MSRYEKAMFKAEVALKESKKAYQEAILDETASWVLVFAYQKKWASEYPDDKFGYCRRRNYKNLEKSGVASYNKKMEILQKVKKDTEFFDLKKRQWQDFLLRDSYKIKHCPCKSRDNSAMVQCDKCSNWTHLKCANLTEKEAQEMPEFICSSCTADALKKFANDFIRHEAGEIDDWGNEIPAD
jgi:PHD-finger